MHTFLVGAGATALLDLWSLARACLGTPFPDYALVGRWIAYMPRGRFRHDSIANAQPMPAEQWVGWFAHYAIGIAFAAMLLAIWGLEWAHSPTLGPALIVGLGSVLAPLLLMQPGMGAGIAARRTPRPWAARGRSFVTHVVFGLGLFVAALLVSSIPHH